jgi:hypothetical protein
MPALVAGIHVLGVGRNKVVDGRDKPGHDEPATHRPGPCVAIRAAYIGIRMKAAIAPSTKGMAAIM